MGTVSTKIHEGVLLKPRSMDTLMSWGNNNDHTLEHIIKALKNFYTTTEDKFDTYKGEGEIRGHLFTNAKPGMRMRLETEDGQFIEGVQGDLQHISFFHCGMKKEDNKIIIDLTNQHTLLKDENQDGILRLYIYGAQKKTFSGLHRMQCNINMLQGGAYFPAVVKAALLQPKDPKRAHPSPSPAPPPPTQSMDAYKHENKLLVADLTQQSEIGEEMQGERPTYEAPPKYTTPSIDATQHTVIPPQPSVDEIQTDVTHNEIPTGIALEENPTDVTHNEIPTNIADEKNPTDIGGNEIPTNVEIRALGPPMENVGDVVRDEMPALGLPLMEIPVVETHVPPTESSEDDEIPANAMQQKKIGPNERCWCQSGRKYKKCHRTKDMKDQATRREHNYGVSVTGDYRDDGRAPRGLRSNWSHHESYENDSIRGFGEGT